MYRIFKNGEVIYETDRSSLGNAAMAHYIKKFADATVEFFNDSTKLVSWFGSVTYPRDIKYVIH